MESYEMSVGPKTSLGRITVWALVIAGVVLAAANPARALFPERPITMIIPWPAGGSSDQTVRAFSKAAEAHLGQPIVVVNKPGAASTIGLSELSTAKPDGYTIGLLTSTAYLLPLTGRKVPYSMPAGFSYVTYMGDNVIGVVVRANSRWKTVQDLIAEGKKNPGTLKYATGGVGTYQHMSAEALARTTGAKFIHIPQKGSAESLPALLGNHVDFITETSIWAPFVESGELSVLAVTTETRPEGLEKVPTMKELGVASLRSFQIIGGPVGMSEGVRLKLEEAFRKASKDKSFLNIMAQLKMMPVDMAGNTVESFIRAQMKTAEELISQLQIPAAK